MNNYKINFKNGRTTTICCSSNEELKSDLIECTKRFNSEIATINDMPTEKLSVGGFLLGTILGGILGNAVAKSGVKKTAKTISKTTKKTISKTRKGVSEFRSASSKSKKMSAGGLGKPTYIPNEDIENIKTNYGQTISGRKLLDGAYATGKVKKPTMSRTQFEDESFEYAKGGNVPSITKKVNEVNRLIALGNENDISVIDSSSTWESPMKYKPIKYSNGTLYIEYEELDLYKNNRTGVKQWITKKDKVLKRNMEYDSPLNNIAKWYRKALKNYDVMFENGGMSSMAMAGAMPELAIADQISQRLPATTSAVDKRIAERIYSDRPSMWEDRGLKYYAKGGTIGQEITFKHWSGDTKNGTITEDLGDGNFQVSSGFGNVLVNQEDIISTGTKSPERKKMFGFFKNGGGVDYYVLQNLKNQESVLEKRLMQVVDNQSDGWRIDKAELESELEIVRNQIQQNQSSQYAGGGGVGGNNNLQQKIDYINNNYNGVVASKTYSDNRIQVVSRYFNTLNEIKRKEFNGSGLLEKYGNLSSYVLYSNQTFAGGGSTDEERYPRLADDTGKGIREGFVIGDGDYYYENEDNLVKHLRSLDYEDADGNSSKDIESDEDLKEFFYNDEYYYFTEWEEDEIEDQGYYYTRDGKEIEIASKGKKISGNSLDYSKLDEDANWYIDRIKDGKTTTTKQSTLESIEEFKKDLHLLEVGRIKPSDIIGKGYKGNTRLIAENWLKENIYVKEKILTFFENDNSKFSGGGSTNSRMDLFEDYENIPPEVQNILDKYAEEFGDDFGGMDYKDMANMHNEIYAVGYTFDSGLDNMAFGLRPVGVNLNELQGFESEPDDDKE
jgi:hypothetical protein